MFENENMPVVVDEVRIWCIVTGEKVLVDVLKTSVGVHAGHGNNNLCIYSWDLLF